MGITLSMTGAFRETGASFFFVPKGALTHHLVVASFISLDPPQSGRSRSLRCSSSPHKAGFAGVPCSAVVSFPSVGPCALRGGSRSLRRAPDNAAELAGFGRRCLCGWQTATALFASSLQTVVPALGQPATRLRQTCHRQLCRRDGRCHPAPSIFFCLRQKKQKRLPAGSRKDVIHYGDLSSGS